MTGRWSTVKTGETVWMSLQDVDDYTSYQGGYVIRVLTQEADLYDNPHEWEDRLEYAIRQRLENEYNEVQLGLVKAISDVHETDCGLYSATFHFGG